jgi:hypothetical protein
MRKISGDFSGDNLTLPQVLLHRDSPVSRVTHAHGASESLGDEFIKLTVFVSEY